MASKQRRLSDFHEATGARRFVDDSGYRQTVLQLELESNQTEEDAEEQLLDEARQLGAVVWDTDVSFSRLLDTNITHTPPPTSSSTSLKPSSTADASTSRIAVSSSSTFASSGAKIPSSRHSIVSSSTCPTFCSCNDAKFPARSRSEKARARYSFDPSRLRSESRDGKLRFGLKTALSRFPSFKKRSSIDLTTPAQTSTCPDCQSPVVPVTESTSCETPVEEPGLQQWNNPKISQAIASPDEASLLRSLQSEELRDMRHAQDNQKERHIAFRSKLMEQMKASHSAMLHNQAEQNQKLEEDMSNQHTTRAAIIEENQLSAELTLVEDFKRQKQSLQSQIRHMEAYFKTPTFNSKSDSDTSPKSESGSARRQYTLEERDRLRQKYHELDSMDRLHESKIKVLRDRQAKRYEEAMRKMEREATDLTEANSQLYQTLEKRCHDEKAATMEWLETRAKRLSTKWMLEEAILRKKVELETNLAYGPLPPLSFDYSQDSPSRDLETTSGISETPNGLS